MLIVITSIEDGITLFPRIFQLFGFGTFTVGSGFGRLINWTSSSNAFIIFGCCRFHLPC